MNGMEAKEPMMLVKEPKATKYEQYVLNELKSCKEGMTIEETKADIEARIKSAENHYGGNDVDLMSKCYADGMIEAYDYCLSLLPKIMSRETPMKVLHEREKRPIALPEMRGHRVSLQRRLLPQLRAAS